MLRVWWEDEDDHPLRFRISRTVGGRDTTTATASVDEVIATVERWIHEVVVARGATEIERDTPVTGA